LKVFPFFLKSLWQISFAFVLLMICTGKAMTITNEDTTGVTIAVDMPDSVIVETDSVTVEDVHRQDSPEERGFLIVTTDRKAQLRIRGSIRMNGAWDFNGLQNQDVFSTYDIPVGDANKTEPRFFLAANQTRLGIEAKRETTLGEAFMRIEGDFLGEGNTIRLRHAFGSVNYLLVGQTWSTFGDVTSIPWTVDLDGPNSAVAERSVQIRYTKNLTDDLRWAAAAEAPELESTRPDSLQIEPTFQSWPDMVARIRKYGDWGHLQFAGVLRSLNERKPDNNLQYLLGYGGLISGSMILVEQNSILFQVVYGKAVARYITALTGKGLDLIFNPNTNEYETLTSFGGFISYGHYWKPDLYSYFTIGRTSVQNKAYQSDDAFSYSQYLSANLFWEATAGVRVGIEYSWGTRVNKNDERGTANRLSFISYYDF
jgi:hypothetical protein